MLHTCEFRDEFTLPELLNSDTSSNGQTIGNSEIFSNSTVDFKSFNQTSLLPIESDHVKIESQPIINTDSQKDIDNNQSDGSFTLTSLNNTFFENDINKDESINEPESIKDNCNSIPLELFVEPVSGSKLPAQELSVENNVIEKVNKRKRSCVQKILIDLSAENDDVFEDEVQAELDKIQFSEETDLDVASKKFKQLQNNKMDFIDRLNESTNEQETFSCNNDQIKVKKPKALPEKATRIMKEWYEANLHNPYPTDEDRRLIAEQGEISENQVKAWFANKRNRSSNTKNKLKNRNVVFDEFKNSPSTSVSESGFDEKINKQINRSNTMIKKNDFVQKVNDQNAHKYNQNSYVQGFPQYLPSMELYNFGDDELKNSKNSRLMGQQPIMNNFPGYYPYFPEPKFADYNNNFFSPFMNQSNSYDYCNSHLHSNIYSPVNKNENFINQNFVNVPITNNLQFYENFNNIHQSCSHNFMNYSDSNLFDCSFCSSCNQDIVSNEIINIPSNNQTPLQTSQRCDTPPPIITKSSFHPSDCLKLEDHKTDNKGLSLAAQKSKFQNSFSDNSNMNKQSCENYNYYNYSFPNSNNNVSFTEFIPIQTNTNFIKSPILSDPLNSEPVSTILDSLNQVQNGLCLPPAQSLYPHNDYNGSTVTINNINYTNQNGNLINSISSILTKPAHLSSSTSSSISSPSPNEMQHMNNSVENFNNMFNLAFNNIMHKNSAFQKYGVQKCLKSNKLSNSSIAEQDSRFSDSKAKEWCIKSHPKLSTTLLNSSNSAYGNFSQNGLNTNESKKGQNFNNF